MCCAYVFVQLSKLEDKYTYLWKPIDIPECKITWECVGKYKYMRGKQIYIRKTCNVWIQHEDVYMCVM